MPEYGRHVQKMIEQIKKIEDKEKRTEQAKAIVNIMSTLNPQLKDFPDYKHKLWDHIFVIANYDLDIDSPYPVPTKESINSKPEPIPLQKDKIKARCYGRNIQGMIDLVSKQEDIETKKELIRLLAIYMRQQYLIWNKDNVADETIFKDMEILSGGKLEIPDGISLTPANGDFNKPGSQQRGNFKRKQFNNNRR
jgi:hypothetical protein